MKPQAQDRGQTVDSKSGRSRRFDIVLLSSDDEFIIELGPFFGDRYRTRTVDQPSALSNTNEGARWAAIIDANSLPDARAAVARLGEQFRHAPLIVIGGNAEDWSGALSRGSILAAIPRDQLEGRLQQALQQVETRLSQEPVPAAASSKTSDSGGDGKTKSLPLIPIIAAAAVAVAGGGWWLLHKPAGQVATPSAGASSHAADTTTSSAPKPQTVLELLSAARVAFRDQKLLLPRTDGDPRGDSALELYTQALSQEPNNDEALDGVKRLFAVGKARIQTDLASGKLDDATRLLAMFKSAGVDADSLRDVDAQIVAARPKWLASRAQDAINAGDFSGADQLISQLVAAGGDRATVTDLRHSIDTKKADQQLTALANDVKTAIDTGALLDPANDNARTRLQAMRNLNRNSAMTANAQKDVLTALIARAADATHKDQFDVAQRYLSAAGDLAATPEVADAKKALQSEMDAVAQRAAAAAAADAKAKAAAAAAAATPAVASASAAKVAPKYIAARPSAPLKVEYPQTAQDGNIEGYVTVEFTLHPDGSASDTAAIESKPAHIFDRAAVEAVLRGHYDTHALVDGKPTRARIRLTFKPN